MASQLRMRREWEAKLQHFKGESSGAAKAALAEVCKERDGLAAELKQRTDRVNLLERCAERHA